jgi:hypothetical protein
LNQGRFGKLAHAHAGSFTGRNAKDHLVLVEGDHVQLQFETRDFLLFDGRDATDTVSGINDRFTGLEPKALGGLLDGCHAREASLHGPHRG